MQQKSNKVYCQNNLTNFSTDIFEYLKKSEEMSMDNKLKKDLEILKRQIEEIDDDPEQGDFEVSSNNASDSNFLLSNTSEMIVLMDKSGIIISFNEKFINYIQKKNVQGSSFYDHFPKDISEFREAQINQVVQSKKSMKFDEEDNGLFFKARIYPMINEFGEVTKIAYHLYNETNHKKRENSILQKIQETEMMLKEVHHRVKNNLQLITSLINLQTAYLTDKSNPEAFKSTIHRIKSMAIVHEKLYKSDTLARINFFNYVKTLSSGLLASYRSTRQVVSVDVEISDVFLNINTAIPCGLILNELITNCLKYAFVDRSEGKITISMNLKAGNIYRLIVKDDGIGLPAEIDINATETLGLKLVHILTDQLHGSLSVNVKKGTEFTSDIQELY